MMLGQSTLSFQQQFPGVDIGELQSYEKGIDPMFMGLASKVIPGLGLLGGLFGFGKPEMPPDVQSSIGGAEADIYRTSQQYRLTGEASNEGLLNYMLGSDSPVKGVGNYNGLASQLPNLAFMSDVYGQPATTGMLQQLMQLGNSAQAYQNLKPAWYSDTALTNAFTSMDPEMRGNVATPTPLQQDINQQLDWYTLPQQTRNMVGAGANVFGAYMGQASPNDYMQGGQGVFDTAAERMFQMKQGNVIPGGGGLNTSGQSITPSNFASLFAGGQFQQAAPVQPFSLGNYSFNF